MYLKRILVVCLAALMLLAPQHRAMAGESLSFTPSPRDKFQPMGAVIASSLNGASNLTNHADDYFIPQGTYFNGVQVIVLAIEETFGDYPTELNDPHQLWARVLIGKNDQFAGIEGLMPLINLDFNPVPVQPALPDGLLIAQTTLFSSNGLDEAFVGSYPENTPFRLLGWLKDWLHVEISGKTGFIRATEADFTPETVSRIFAALPEGFDEIQPGYQARYEAYMAELMPLYERYGDSNKWPLAISAQASKLASDAGFQFTDIIYVLPGQDDLKEEAVAELAKDAAQELFGLGKDTWESASLAFFHYPGAPDERFWKVSLWNKEGLGDVRIWMDAQGKVVNSMRDEAPYAEGLSVEQAQEAQDTLEYYFYGRQSQPEPGDLSEQAAIDLAWGIYTQNVGQKDRAAHVFESRFLTNDEGSLRWFLVTIVEKRPEDIQLSYHVALVMPDGQTHYATAPERYLEDQKWADSLQLFLEKEKVLGPFNTWSLEEKAAYDPEYFGLPEGRELQQDAARKAADEALKAAYSITDEEMTRFEVSYFFIRQDRRVWQIVYQWEGPDADMPVPGYTVRLDALTGEVLDIFTNEYAD